MTFRDAPETKVGSESAPILNQNLEWRNDTPAPNQGQPV